MDQENLELSKAKIGNKKQRYLPKSQVLYFSIKDDTIAAEYEVDTSKLPALVFLQGAINLTQSSLIIYYSSFISRFMIQMEFRSSLTGT